MAEEAYRTAMAEAEAKGLTTTGEDSVVGRVSEVARATLDKARRSAAEAGLVGSSDEQSSGQGGYQAAGQNADQSGWRHGRGLRRGGGELEPDDLTGSKAFSKRARLRPPFFFQERRASRRQRAG